MKEEFIKKLVKKLAQLGYGETKDEKILLNKDKINNKIKEIKILDISKELCVYVNDREYLISVLATLSISKDYNEFKKILNSPKDIKKSGALPEISLRYIILNLFYDIGNPEKIKGHYRFKPFENMDEYIDKYEQIFLVEK